MRTILIAFTTLLLLALQPLNGISTQSALAGEGGDAGVGSVRKTIKLNKETYTRNDLVAATRSYYLDGDVVIIVNAGKYSSYFLSFARYNSRLAADLLNKWLRTKDPTQRYKLAKKAAKTAKTLLKAVQAVGGEYQEVNERFARGAVTVSNSIVDKAAGDIPRPTPTQ